MTSVASWRLGLQGSRQSPSVTTALLSTALFGLAPSEAFFAKCDDETNPADVRDRGQMIVEIGMAPVKPAEFVIFRISQWGGPGSE